MPRQTASTEEPACEQVEQSVPADVIIVPPATVEPISIARLSDGLVDGMGALPTVRLGIVCMTKGPESFERWLCYHVEALRVERFFLRVEDTPQLEVLLSTPPWSHLCVASFHTGQVRCWQGQTERQADHVRTSVERARAEGLTHLLHIDDDEVFYLPSGLRTLWRHLARSSSAEINLHALTLEALVPRDADALADNLDGAAACPLGRCRAFRHRRRAYTAYGSAAHAAGKSIGRLRCASLQPASPHHFCADRFHSAAQGFMSGTRLLPCHVAVVLHYESCSYARWRTKFTDYAHRHRHIEATAQAADDDENDAPPRAGSGRVTGEAGEVAQRVAARRERAKRDAQKLSDPSFWFYQQSMRACLRLLEAEEAASACPSSAVYRGKARVLEDECRKLWATYKLEPPGLPPLHPHEPYRVLTRSSLPAPDDAPMWDVGGPRVDAEECTLIRPLIDAATGRVDLPRTHLDGAHPPAAMSAAPSAPATPAAVSFGATMNGATATKGVQAARTLPSVDTPPPPAPGRSGGAQRSRWLGALVARAGLPVELVSKLADAADVLAAAGNGSDVQHDAHAAAQAARVLVERGTATRGEVDALARHAGLLVGQRMRLRNAVDQVEVVEIG